jgi:hypothetical protein
MTPASVCRRCGLDLVDAATSVDACSTCGHRWDGPVTPDRERLAAIILDAIAQYQHRHPNVSTDEKLLALVDVETAIEEHARAAEVRA